jgi:hypothetical protein
MSDGHIDYHDSHHLSRSDLRAIHRDIAEWHARLEGLLPPIETTPAMQWGIDLDRFICHEILPPIMPPGVTEIPAAVLAKNGARSGNKWKEYAAENAGQRLMTAREIATYSDAMGGRIRDIQACVAEIRGHAKADHLLFHPRANYQMELYWEETGLALKAMPDLVIDGLAIVDLKTSSDVSAEHFLSQSRRYWYDVQAYLCQRGYYKKTGNLLPVVFVVVLSRAPWTVEVYEVSEGIIEHGYQRYCAARNVYDRAINSGSYRSPTHGTVVKLEPPRFWRYVNEYDFSMED